MHSDYLNREVLKNDQLKKSRSNLALNGRVLMNYMLVIVFKELKDKNVTIRIQQAHISSLIVIQKSGNAVHCNLASLEHAKIMFETAF